MVTAYPSVGLKSQVVILQTAQSWANAGVWTNSFYCLFRKTRAKWGERNCPSFETAEVESNHRSLCTLRISNQNINWYSIKQLSQHTELVTTCTSYKWALTQGFWLEKIPSLEDKFVWLHCIQKGNSSNIHNVIKYLTIRLSGVNTATQVCTLCVLY